MRPAKYKVDKMGVAILEILDQNSRIPEEDIARQLDIPVEQVSEYIKRFEQDRIIVRYSAHINWERIKQNEVRALIEVRVSPEHGVGFDAIAENIYRFPEVSGVTLLSGGYDLLVQIEGNSLQEVALFVSQKLAPIKGVLSTVTHFRLKTYKEDGQILVEEPESRRLPFSF